MKPHFTISAEMAEDGTWTVSVTEFYDDQMDTHALYREIAEALIPIAGGMIHSAEDLEPTRRGCIISNITIYQDGFIEMRNPPMDTPERKAWLVAALNKVKRRIQRGAVDKSP